MQEPSHNSPNKRYPRFVGKSPLPLRFAKRESPATAIIERRSQMTNLHFPIIKGSAATTPSVMSEPTTGFIATAIQKVIHGISIVVIEGFFKPPEEA